MEQKKHDKDTYVIALLFGIAVVPKHLFRFQNNGMITERNRIDDTSLDMKAELMARLRALVLEAFSDGNLDLDHLGELAGDAVAAAHER